MSLINVGDHEILWETDSISLNERHFMACCSIQWEKMGICQLPIRSFEKTLKMAGSFRKGPLKAIIWQAQTQFVEVCLGHLLPKH